MIHLTQHDARELSQALHPLGTRKCHPWACAGCDFNALCCTLLEASYYSRKPASETALREACIHFRDYTDAVCDTYTCPTCPDYSWCTTLRGIAIEGVKLDTD